jgi:GT2 family glycosyltransferase
MKQLVSIIMPSYNRKSILKKVLCKIYSYRYSFSFEIIVIDNASTDNSVFMIKKDFPQVRLYSLNRNIGAASRNIGIAKASGKYLVMLDDDSYPAKNTIEKSIQILENPNNSDIGCIALNVKRADASFETSGIYTHFTGCGAVFKKSIFKTIGYYPKDYLFYAEEYDLSCRIWNNNFKVLNFRELEAVHLKTGVNRNFEKIICQLVRNNMLLWSKYLPVEEVQRQIRTELWRYEKIALKEGVYSGFLRGKELGERQVAKFQKDRKFEVSSDALNQILDKKNIKYRIKKISNIKRLKNIIIFNIGKLIHQIIREINDNNAVVVGIVDDNQYMQQDEFEGIKIYSRDRLNDNSYDAIIIGSSSLSLNDQFYRELSFLNLSVPIFRMCDYDKLESYY